MQNLFTITKNIGTEQVGKFKTFSLKKKILVVVIGIILLIAVLQIYSNLTKKPPYTLARVEISSITEIVTETGNITASGKADIYSPTNGIVEEVFVANGDAVTEGQDMFAVESSASEQETQAAYSNYLTAQATLNAANSNLNVLKSAMLDAWDEYYQLATGDFYENADGSPKVGNRTLPEFHIAQNDWLAAEAKYKDQQTLVAQGQALVSSTWILYQSTQNAVVKAPSAGFVSNLAVTKGSSVSIYSPTLSTRPVLTISSSGATEAVVSLSETDITKVKVGQEAVIDVDAASSKEYKGIVRRVDSIGTSTAGVVRYSVYIEIINRDNNLLSGMSADIDIITRKVDGVLTVPNSAVKPYQGKRAVRVLDSRTKQVKYIPVEIGVRGESKTQIIKGLNEGQEVVTALSNEQLKRPGLFGM